MIRIAAVFKPRFVLRWKDVTILLTLSPPKKLRAGRSFSLSTSWLTVAEETACDCQNFRKNTLFLRDEVVKKEGALGHVSKSFLNLRQLVYKYDSQDGDDNRPQRLSEMPTF